MKLLWSAPALRVEIYLVDKRVQRRMARLVRADKKKKNTVTQITTLYSFGEQRSISEHTAR